MCDSDIFHLCRRKGIRTAIGLNHTQCIFVTERSLPVVICGNTGSPKHHWITSGPFRLVKCIKHVSAGPLCCLHLHIFDQLIYPVCEVRIQRNHRRIIIVIIMEPCPGIRILHLPAVRVMSQIIIDRRGDHKDIPHHRGVSCRPGTAHREDIRIRKVKSGVCKNRHCAQCRTDLAHSGHIQRNTVFHIQLTAGASAGDFISVCAIQIRVIVKLRFARIISGHLTFFEFRQYKHADRNRLIRVFCLCACSASGQYDARRKCSRHDPGHMMVFVFHNTPHRFSAARCFFHRDLPAVAGTDMIRIRKASLVDRNGHVIHGVYIDQ